MKSIFQILKMIVICFMLIFFLETTSIIYKAVAANAAAVNATQDPVLSTIVMGIKTRESMVQSAQGYITKEMYNSKNPELISRLAQDGRNPITLEMQKRSPSLWLYFWAADGEKAREDVKAIVGPDAPHYTMDAYDGDRGQDWEVGQHHAGESGDDGRIVGSLTFNLQLPLGRGLRSSEVSVSKLIASQKSRVEDKEIIGGIETYKIVLSPNTGANTIRTCWIAPELGYLMIKLEAKPTPESGGYYRNVIVVDTVRKVSKGLWIPTSFREVGYTTIDDHREAWRELTRYTLLSFKVNEQVSSEMFHLPLPPGTIVGGDGRTVYRVKGDEASFKKQFNEAQREGTQPDLDEIDLTAFKTRVVTGQPNAEELRDIPMQNFVLAK